VLFDVRHKIHERIDLSYPRLDHDGIQLAVVDRDPERVLAAPLPTVDERFAAKPGDVVKLVFEYREPDVRENGAVVGSEHMWVRITEQRDGCLFGTLDRSPQHSELLSDEATVSFHPRHIVAFWPTKPTGEEVADGNPH